MAFDDFGHHGIGLAVEAAVEQLRRIDEELVNLYAQSFGQAMERLGVRLIAAVENAPDGPLVEAGPLGHPAERQSPAAIRRSQISRA